jgi:hypothetical protein
MNSPSLMTDTNSSRNDKTMYIVLIIAVVALLWFSGFFDSKKEDYRPMTQNFVYTNKNDIADKLEYGEIEEPALDPKSDGMVMGPNSNFGVNENSPTDVFDRRGFKWTENAKNPLVDEITEQSDNQQLRKNFERTYMLDPVGNTAQYDITYNTISPNCCPAQYAPPFPLTDDNCDYAQKYVANQYSGMNFKDGYGCTCMTKDQAKFFGNRGNNTE